MFILNDRVLCLKYNVQCHYILITILISLQGHTCSFLMIVYYFLITRKPVEHFLKAVDEVTLQDIASIAHKLLSSPLTMASYGDGT